MSFTNNKLQCDMKRDCDAPVTHIDNKGFAYCQVHGEQRKDSHPCRRLQVWEVRVLQRGESLYHYTPMTQQEFLRRRAEGGVPMSAKTLLNDFIAAGAAVRKQYGNCGPVPAQLAANQMDAAVKAAQEWLDQTGGEGARDVIALARQEHEKEGECEIDEDAIISWGDDDGAYVQAWVWVHLDHCDECEYFEVAHGPECSKRKAVSQ